MDLAMVKQEQGETLRKYMLCFFDKRATVVDVTDKEVIDLFQDGLYHRRTFEDFGRRRPSSITKLKDMITSWADEEDKANAKYDAIRGKSKQNAGGSNNNNRDQGGRNNNYSGPNRKCKPDNTVAAIQRSAKDNSKKTSGGLKDLVKEKCLWHLEGNHTTDQCYQLRRALKDSPDPRPPHNKKGKKKADEGNGDFQEPDKTVNVLFGGLPTKRSQKATGREVLNIELAVLAPLRWSEVPITFSRADQWTSFSEPGRFSLILKPVVAGSRLNKVLIDGGSELNVLFTKTLKKMKLDITHMLAKSKSPFYGIIPGNAAIPLGSVVLLVTFRETGENYHIEYIKFEVANFETSYYAILGRSAIAKFMAVPHYTYLVLKMPSPAGVLSLQGDLKISFDCDTEAVELAATNQVPNAMMEIYAASKKLAPSDLDIPEKSDKANKPQSSEEVQVKAIDLGTGDSSKTTMIGAGLDPKKVDVLVSFLRANRDIFAWKPRDMPGVPRNLIEHSLNIDPKATPKRQHLRHFADDRRDAIKKELAKLLADGFIKEVFHPEWLANLVLIRKKNTNEWRMCVDYTDLNKHCPKDSFGLPRIDQVIDSTTGCDLLCFLDCYSGYHQIAIKEEDHEKTTFITPFGAYCYTTMSFGLKNTGATYQRAIQACFKRQLNKNVEAYVDDVVVKTRNSDMLIADLEETFASLREYRWKLNPNKCIFGVPSRKLLGFIISHRGIEANPEKISAITKLKAPTCIKDVQKLIGCMAALNRFISKLGEWGLSFFKLLNHQEKFVWTPEADQALAQLKDFLSKPPVLTAPRKKKQLLLYLAATSHVVSAAIVVERQEDGHAYPVQRPVYFVSEVLSESKVRYQPVQKLLYAVLITSQKL
jgi:hypothetical protein